MFSKISRSTLIKGSLGLATIGGVGYMYQTQSTSTNKLNTIFSQFDEEKKARRDWLEKTLKSGNVNARNNCEETPLMIACSYGDLDLVKNLINLGADVNARTMSGFTALFIVVSSDNTVIVEELIKAGADPNEKAFQCVAPLTLATSGYHSETAKTLIEMGAKIDDDSFYNVVSRDDVEMVKFFLQRGANPNGFSKDGFSVLGAAKSRKVIKMLLGRGADINAKDCLAQKITVADLLLLRGGVCISRPERAESDIDKAFLEACELQDLDQVKILVRQGANINVYDENKATGLQFAAYSGNHDLAEYLLNLGCDTRHENVLGDTAKYCALCQRHVEIVKMIEKAEQA